MGRASYSQVSFSLVAWVTEKCLLVLVNVAPRYTMDSTISTCTDDRVKTFYRPVGCSCMEDHSLSFSLIYCEPIFVEKIMKGIEMML